MLSSGTGARAPALLLACFAGLAALLAAVEVAAILAGPGASPWSHALVPLVGLCYCLASVVAFSRRPHNRTCALLAAAGLAWYGAGLARVESPLLVGFGEVVALLPVAIAIHLLLAFPAGVLGTRLDRLAVAAAYLATVPLLAPSYLFGGEPAPFDVLELADLPALVDLGTVLRALLGWAISVAIVISLRRRLAAAGERQRRALRPFAAYAVLALIAIPIVTNLLPLATPIGDAAVDAVQLLLLAGFAAAAVATMLRGGFARTGAIEELAASIAASQRTGLREALAQTLGDPSLGLGFRLEDGSLVDAGGSPYAPAGQGPDRGLRTVSVDGRPLATIDFDRTAVGEADYVDAAAQVVAIWLERERLTAALLASDAELRRSRLRVIAAADGERRRIAQDLHDGLASQLLMVGLRLDSALAADSLPAATAARLRGVTAELEAAIAALRRLVHGVMPAGLVERGLAAALEDLVDLAPPSTTLRCEGVEGLSPELESTAYFVVAEALANAVKHAGAERIEVAVRVAGEELRIEVADDGAGGAAAGAGAGLRGMADRVEAYGGSLAVASAPAAGTTIRAVLPSGRQDEPEAGAGTPGAVGERA